MKRIILNLPEPSELIRLEDVNAKQESNRVVFYHTKSDIARLMQHNDGAWSFVYIIEPGQPIHQTFRHMQMQECIRKALVKNDHDRVLYTCTRAEFRAHLATWAANSQPE